VNRNLTELALGGNEVGPEGAYALADALRGNETLRVLDLGENNIGDPGAGALGRGLCENRALTSLDLGWNSIRESGAQSLAAALRENATLQTLDLRLNHIGDLGVAAFAEGLATNVVLCNLRLHDDDEDASDLDNDVTRGGLDALRECLALAERNRALPELRVAVARVAQKGAVAARAADGMQGDFERRVFENFLPA
jgi:Ran GTPase-activating protein (RanGAP) involved in mRNA processing and transport